MNTRSLSSDLCFCGILYSAGGDFLTDFDFCVSMHHHIWLLLGPACCKLFSAVFITLFALHVSDVIHIHPQERYKMYMQMVQVSARVS